MDPVLEAAFSGGINQSDQDELLTTASFATLQNVRQAYRGAVSKRLAYESLGKTRLDATERTVGRRIVVNDEQICTVNDTNIDVYVPSQECFVERSRLPEAAFGYFEVPTVGLNLVTQPYVADVAVVNGFICVAHVAPGTGAVRDCYVSIIDATTKAVIRGPELLESSSTGTPEFGLATFGTSFALAYCSPTLQTIYVDTIDTATPATISAGWTQLTFITATATSGQLAMASLPTQTDRFAIAYDVGIGADRVIVKTIGASGVIETAAMSTSFTTPQTDTIDLSEHGETLWVCWGIANTAFVAGLDPANIDGVPLAAEDESGIFTTGSLDYLFVATAGVGRCMLSANGAGEPFTVRCVKTLTGSAVADSPSAQEYFNARAIGRPFYRDGIVYQWVGSNNRDELVLCDITQPSGGHVANFPCLRPVVVPVVRGLVAAYLFQRCRTASLGNSVYTFAFPAKKTGVSAGTVAISIDFLSADRWTSAAHHQSTYLAGGVTMAFDGAHAFESGFLCAPPSPAADTSDSGSMTFTNGGRRYVAVYTSIDADGNMSVSGVSNPSDPTGDITSKTVKVYVEPLSITARVNLEQRYNQALTVEVFLYATTDGAEAPYHLIKSRTNFPQGATLEFEDNFSDDGVNEGALLYGSGNLPGTVTNGQPGGPQDHRAPPGLRFLTVYQGMLVGATDNEVWHTGQPVYGEAPWWSPVFTQQIDGKITSLFVADGTLYATTRSGIYAMTGDPPNDAGTSGGLSAPRKLGIDRGCINARSVVVTSSGTFFQSDRGIELFRQETIEAVGDLVQDELREYPLVTSAVFDTTRALVRFSLATTMTDGLVDPPTDADDGPGVDITGGGRDLVFDLILGTWISVDIKHGSTDLQASQDAAMVTLDGERRYAWLAADGELFIESQDNHVDPNDTWVTQRAETGWVHVAGLQGEQFIDRLLLLAKSVTAHDVSISLAFDYGEYGTPRLFTSTQLATLAREWLDIEVLQTTSQSVRVLIEDAPPSGEGADIGTGKGATWIALTFGGVPHRGVKRTTSAQRGG